MTHDLLQTPQPFQQWLECQTPDAIVGKRATCCDCPLATFLKRQLHLKDPYAIEVNEDELYVDFEEYTLPQWAQQFIVEVDDQGESYEQVTAAEAQSLLTTVLTQRGLLASQRGSFTIGMLWVLALSGALWYGLYRLIPWAMQVMVPVTQRFQP